MKVQHFINNQEVHAPLNEDEFALELNFDKDATRDGEPIPALSITSTEWGLGDQLDPMDGAYHINKHREDGLTGGVGALEALPYRVLLSDDNFSIAFELFLNTASAKYDCDRITAEVGERKGIDYFNIRADGWSFEKGFKEGEFDSSEFIPIPYVLSELPQTREALLAAISLFVVAEAVSTQIQEVNELLTGTTNPLQFADVLKLALRLIYIAALFLTIISLVKQIINLLIQPVKYHNGMNVKRLCEIGAAHFGYNFSSPILDSAGWEDAVIMPEKFNHDVNSNSESISFLGIGGLLTTDIIGFQTPNDPTAMGYYRDTFGDLLRALKDMFNAKVIIQGNDMKLVRRDFNNSPSNYVIPDVDDNDFSLNYEQFVANYNIKFLTDLNDKNTLQDYLGTAVQVISEPKGTVNADLDLTGGIKEVVIPFARGKRKEELTNPEKIVRVLAQIVDAVVGTLVQIVNGIINTINDIIDTINDIIDAINLLIPGDGPFDNLSIPNIPTINWTSLTGLIDDRIGMLLMENDWVDVPKMMIMDVKNNPRETDVSPLDRSFIRGLRLWNDFHFIESFIPRTGFPNANQKLIFDKENIPGFCLDDLQLLLNSNAVQDAKGRNGEAISARWRFTAEVIDLDYNVPALWTRNLKETIIETDGK